MKLYIKRTVSIRCKPAVQIKLDDLGLYYGTVDLGEIEFKNNITPQQHGQLQQELQHVGVELLDQPNGKLIEKIKAVIFTLVNQADTLPRIKNSVYIGQQVGRDYTYLANLFSEATGATIEHSIISHRIERVKELLLYDELNLTEIAHKLNYSSVSHLSAQFKKESGLTPTSYKQLKHKRRHL